jgi:eukaryotic-like serine/threonine-protein kinase
VILRSIAKDPNMRFPTASAMTIALAKALRVAAPSSLSKPGIVNEQPEYNPLQPSGLTPYPPVIAVSPPVLLTPDQVGHLQAEAQFHASSPPPLEESERQLPRPAVAPILPERAGRLHNGLYITLITCVLLLVGISAFLVIPRLLSKNTPLNVASGVVGHITFIHSPNTPSNTFNQLQITLNNISSPPAGKTYYAWLVNNELTSPLNWELQFSNGTTHYSTTVDTSPPKLLTNYTQFVVTIETPGAPAAVPAPLSALYFAIITPTSSTSPSYEVKQCPTSGTNLCI